MTPAGVTLHRLVRRREVGVVLALLGAVLIVAGVLRTTAGKPDSSDCPAGTTLVAKFNFVGGSYVFEKPAGNETVVTITGGAATGGSWSSAQAISAVVVKGGPNAVVTSYSPAATSGTFSNAGLPPVGSGNLPDVSHLEFCGGGSGNTTTTAASTTSTTGTATTTTTTTTTTSSTSTTTPTVPTTTAPATTTTVAIAATTTVPQQPTTTTAAPATTTTVAATTTEADSPTTTVASAATTTPGEPSPSTTLPAGATTSTTGGRAGSAVATSTTMVPVRGEPDAELPRTGAPSLPLIALGLVLVTTGAALAIVNGRRDQARAPRST